MALERTVPGAALLWVLAWSASAQAHRLAGIECEPPPSPSPGSQGVPTNVLLFGLAAETVQGTTTVATSPAPPPWNADARYRVPVAPLAPNAAYEITVLLTFGTSVASFTTAAGPDDVPPSAPVALGHLAADPSLDMGCMADHLELLPIDPSVDDQTPATELRYSVSQELPDGGLQLAYAELIPIALGDGGVALPLPFGLSGLPGSYVIQARDWAGNLSAPSAPVTVEVGPNCDFAESTAGGAPPSLLALSLLGLWILRGLGKRARGR